MKQNHTIRRTVTFHEVNDSTILDYLEIELAKGKDFTAVIRELLLQIITLHQFRLLPGGVHTTHMKGDMNLLETVHTPLPNGDMNQKLGEPFRQLEDRYG